MAVLVPLLAVKIAGGLGRLRLALLLFSLRLAKGGAIGGSVLVCRLSGLALARGTQIDDFSQLFRADHLFGAHHLVKFL